ncbi:MAG: hypothetical protein ACYC96_03885 [Fimbriimonadaceae bacterium]
MAIILSITIALVTFQGHYPGLPYSSNPAMSFSASPATVAATPGATFNETATVSDKDTFTDPSGKQFLAINDSVEITPQITSGSGINANLAHNGDTGVWTLINTIQANSPTVTTLYHDGYTFTDTDTNVILNDATQTSTILVTVTVPSQGGTSGGQ